MLKKGSIAFLLLLFGNTLATQDIDVEVTTKFNTTVNLSTIAGTFEPAGAVAMAFEMGKQLYTQIDEFPDTIANRYPIVLAGISVQDIKISAPELLGSENINAAIRMAYKNSMLDTALPLFYANGWSVSTLKNGTNLNKLPELDTFNSIMQNDALNINVPRQLNKVIFVIKLKLDGADAATIDLEALEVQVELVVKLHYIMKM